MESMNVSSSQAHIEEKKVSIEELNNRIKQLEAENNLLKKQHIEINRAKELYLKIFEEFPALIWRSRLDKLCDYFNKTWLDFTGRTMEQEFGNGWAEGVHPDDFDNCLNIYVNSFDKREAFVMEYRMKNSLGEYRWIRDFGRPFYDLDNTFLGYIGSCYDITPIKDHEIELIELNATKDKFFSIIAHDLRSPFNNILSLIGLMEADVKEKNYDSVGDYSKLIVDSSKKAMDLLANLMLWACSQTGKMQFHPTRFDICQTSKEIIDLMSDAAKQKSITLNIDLPTENFSIVADKDMLSSTIRNLITNAIKFTQKNGTVSLKITKENKHILFTIQDTGVGIAPESLKKIFSIHKDASTLGTVNEKGTGLGLLLCKEFVEKHNGSIWAESELNKGSSFKFSIPV